MRYFLVLWFFLIAFRVLAQNDTILLKSVDVVGFSEEKYLKGSAFTTIDSTLLRENSSSHLGDLLSLQLSAYFRNYGNGGISGIALRGTAPQHTAVLWNGININSLSHGQTDFSIIPSVAVDQINVHEGGGSSRFGSGAFGGTVLLNSSTAKSTGISLVQELGSFNRFFTTIKATALTGKWGTAIRAYNQVSENDFLVKETAQTQPHAAYLQRGVLSDLSYFIGDGAEVKFNYWFHESDRDIQPTIGQTISDDNQQDYNHRVSLQYRRHSHIGLLVANVGYINDVIVYNNDRSETERLVGKLALTTKLLKLIDTEIFAEGNAIKAQLENYENGMAHENRYDIGTSFSYSPAEVLRLSFNLRQPIVTGFTAPLLPYLGVQYDFLQGEDYRISLRVNGSRNYRIPTLNDRYWKNAGNRNLLPETSLATETGIQFSAKKISATADGFYQLVDQWILWERQVDGDWIPKNINAVAARGLQVSSRYTGNISALHLDAFVTWQYTRSTIIRASAQQSHTLGKQLIYTPFFTGSGVVNCKYWKFSMSPSVQFTGERYTDTSNDDLYALPPFFLYNAQIGYHSQLRQHRFDLSFAVKNIGNKSYQLYAARAMPGRHYSVQANYQITLTKKQK